MGNKVSNNNDSNYKEIPNEDKIQLENDKQKEYFLKLAQSMKNKDNQSNVSSMDLLSKEETCTNVVNKEVQKSNLNINVNSYSEYSKFNTLNQYNKNTQANSFTIKNDNNSDKISNNNINAPPKNIDLEHVTIEKMFRITLDKSKADKFKYLEEYEKNLKDLNKEIKFRTNDMDNLIISIIDIEKNNILDYLLITYHRAYELIEVKYKDLLKEKFCDTLRMIASYLSLIATSPENFDLSINYIQAKNSCVKYFDETTNDNEVYNLFCNLYTANEEDEHVLKIIFEFFINTIHARNVKNHYNNQGSFFKCDLIKKHLLFLSTWLEQNSKYGKTISIQKSFLPNEYNMTNLGMSTGTIFGIYCSLNIFDTEFEEVKRYLGGITMNEAKVQTNNMSEKLFYYVNQLTPMVFALLNHKNMIDYLVLLIKLNQDKLKMVSNIPMSSDGFLINVVLSLVNCFFKDMDCTSLERVITIDTDIFLSSEIAFLEKTDHSFKPDENNKKINISVNDFNTYSKSFLFGHILLGFAIESLSKLNRKLVQKVQELQPNPNNPEFRKIVTLLNMIYSISKSQKIVNKIIQFLEVTIYLLFTRKNKKYNLNEFISKGSEFFLDFHNDFTFYIEDEENEEINYMPTIIFQNISRVVKFLRETNQEAFNNINYNKSGPYLQEVKNLVHFSLIYSSKTKIIKNPYLRAEALEIVEYFFINQYNNNNNYNNQRNKLISVFNDNLIKENFLHSLVRVFIDSERLGGSNQFYEKFGIRYKILLLIDSIKSQISIDDQLVFYATKFKDDCIQFVNYLINDLTFLADESLDRLQEIKSYQDLKLNNKDTYNALSEEEKKRIEEKFKENSDRCKNFIPLFNSSLEFMITISNTCQSLILEYKLGSKLATLLNYLLQMFASKNSSNLKIQNFSEYKFNPKDILRNIMNVYANFVNYEDFYNFIINDERSFNIDNFIRAKNLRNKIKIKYNIGEDFIKLINGLIKVKENLAENIIDYDDAPDEYLDPITADIMEDPVKLPSSGQIVDRFVIEQHILSDPKDPFNRSPLDKSMLIPLPDLKAKIEEYKNKKINNKNILNKTSN